ncbi:glycosyltransferase 87 family protein [Actinomycetes bacterium KLBMP 9797]
MTRRWPTYALVGGAAVTLTAVVVAAVAVRSATGRYWIDLAVYRTSAAVAGRGDGAVYELVFGDNGAETGFTYPPFAALLLQPLAHVSMVVAVGAWTLASILALFAAVWVALRAAGVPAERRGVLALVATAAAVPMFAVLGHLQSGQIGVFLMLLVLVDLTTPMIKTSLKSLERIEGRLDQGGAPWWHGVGVGIAAGIKLTPLIFVVYLIAIGRIRAAATAMAAFLATAVVGLAWRPADSRWFWGGGLLTPSRVTGDPRTPLNQSLRGTIARLTDSADPGLAWLVVAALVGAAGIVVAARITRAGDPLLGLLACATTGLLVSPISWHHHWVWVVPALVVLGLRAWHARSRAGLAAVAGTWLVFVATTTWVLAGAWHGGPLYTNLYVLLGLAFLIALATPMIKASVK